MGNDEVPIVTNDHDEVGNSPRVLLASVNKRPPLNDFLSYDVERPNTVKVADIEFIPPLIHDFSKS